MIMKTKFILFITAIILMAQTAITITGIAKADQETFTLPPMPLVWQPKLSATWVCNPAVVTSGSSASCTVTINKIAPSPNGATVSLSSSDTTKFTVPATVTIPPGQTTVTFLVTAM